MYNGSSGARPTHFVYLDIIWGTSPLQLLLLYIKFDPNDYIQTHVIAGRCKNMRVTPRSEGRIIDVASMSSVWHLKTKYAKPRLQMPRMKIKPYFKFTPATL